MHAVEHMGANKAFKEGTETRNIYIFPSILQIPCAINTSKIGVIRAIGGPKKLFLVWFYIHAFLKIMLPNEGGKQIFKKSDKKVEGRGM